MAASHKALFVDDHANFSVIERNGEDSTLDDGEVLIETIFSGVNPADIKHATQLGIVNTVIGYDFCGRIIKIKEKSEWKVGDIVAGYTPSGVGRQRKYGTHQDYIVCPESMLFKVPEKYKKEKMRVSLTLPENPRKNMRFPNSYLLSTPLLIPPSSQHSPYWPSPHEWSTFNASISGNLLTPHPSASPCHAPFYNATLCAIATTEWNNSFWRTAQPGAYSGILWEVGQDRCFVDEAVEVPCGQGLVPVYMVRAEGVEDVVKAVRWAGERGIRVGVKNTGHDQ